MLGTGLQFGRGHGEDRFYNPVKARRNHHQQQQQQQQLHRARNNGAANPAPWTNGKALLTENRELENRVESEEPSKPIAMPASEPAVVPSSNLDQFLESTTPSVPAQYLSKTRMRGWRTCDVEFQPYFNLGDLWESFKEWSAYGAGVPLILNGSDCVVQYYVPYLSAIQIYGESTRSSCKTRQLGEDSDGDYYRDSSSDGSSDCELERGGKFPREQWNHYHLPSETSLRMERLSLREEIALQEGFSSDDGESGNSCGCLLFEFLERDPPYSREPLADKISDLASRFPELKTLRSCDLLPTSWVSVAWYPIYRIPTGPTLRDLDACFLTFHSLSTPMQGGRNAPTPLVAYPNGMDDNWLRLLQVNHPDFQFFVSHGTCRR
ncbi:PREDICTED: uncharacterized protein LOC104613287 isoform X2 [Nelumbo nucifera]|uniref:Uncharacterized protein n=2 Tax=Nelumbo nucifera TaxID=4432 RepID=A0A822YIB7_NELNU|nr:PREDICTED: uncharacterized protein LOC104613287 isoform X2 [Nelumbo nucifera]DAD31863.1 TPA_asm: hypothetical protein HUJ06_010714 [Nelumbo nucifera]